jgi:nucleoside-diphosphate-sugar epimerase
MKKIKKIIITGGSGYLGKILTKYLSKNYKIITIDKKNFNSNLKNHIHISTDLKSFFDKRKLSEIYAIIHLAGESRNSSYNSYPKLGLENVKNIYSILESIVKVKKKPKLIFASTKQIENDLLTQNSNSYSISKKFCEDLIIHYIKTYKISASIVRFSDIFSLTSNPSEKAFGKFLKLIKENKKIIVDNKKHNFELIDTKIIEKNMNLILKKRKNCFLKIYGEKINIVDLINSIKKLYNSRSKIIFRDKSNSVRKNKIFIKSKIIFSKKNFFYQLKKMRIDC